jgi:hypothetical protein
MTDSVSVLGLPTRSTDSVTRSYVRTNERTNADLYSPSSDNSPFVTRTRAYGFGVGR